MREDPTRAELEAEVRRIIGERPPHPPNTSNEVLAHDYRLIEAQALINLCGPFGAVDPPEQEGKP